MFQYNKQQWHTRGIGFLNQSIKAEQTAFIFVCVPLQCEIIFETISKKIEKLQENEENRKEIEEQRKFIYKTEVLYVVVCVWWYAKWANNIQSKHTQCLL